MDHIGHVSKFLDAGAWVNSHPFITSKQEKVKRWKERKTEKKIQCHREEKTEIPKVIEQGKKNYITEHWHNG